MEIQTEITLKEISFIDDIDFRNILYDRLSEDIGVRPTQLIKNKQYYRSLGQVSICSKIFHGC